MVHDWQSRLFLSAGKRVVVLHYRCPGMNLHVIGLCIEQVYDGGLFACTTSSVATCEQFMQLGVELFHCNIIAVSCFGDTESFMLLFLK